MSAMDLPLRDVMVECIRVEVVKLELVPGDILGITFKNHIPPCDEVAYINRQLERLAPGVKVAFFGPNIDLAVIKGAAPAEAVSA